jgi:hypothetical protein
MTGCRRCKPDGVRGAVVQEPVGYVSLAEFEEQYLLVRADQTERVAVK